MKDIQILDDLSMRLYDDGSDKLPRELVIIVKYKPIQGSMLVSEDGIGAVNINVSRFK